jgi:hypothetical protein
MNLDEAQRKQVAGWVASGQRLSEIQKRLASELGITLTYMDVRLLVDDLKLIPKDPEPVKPRGSSLAGTGSAPGATVAARPGQAQETAKAPSGAGAVSLSVDQLARGGALVSGKVTFSDGQRADWFLDQTGQFGLNPAQRGYRPSAADLQQFQMKLEAELSRIGF